MKTKSENNNIKTIKEQFELRDNWLETRLKSVLPEIMKREKFDMWIVMGREYNEDPVLPTLFPSRYLSARRCTILCHYLDKNGDLETFSLAPADQDLDRFYKPVWSDMTESQMECLSKLIKEKQPDRIGLNYSDTFALADGLSHTLYMEFMKSIEPEFKSRIFSAEKLVLGWLETRLDGEIEFYSIISEITHDVISEVFSKKVVQPGVTTTGELQWQICQRINELGLSFWFSPDIDFQRQGKAEKRKTGLIQAGDILHCDVGLHYLGLASDVQRLAYVLRPGETDVPSGIKSALKEGNRLQEILASCFVSGRTGNEILIEALSTAEKENLKAMIYSHPIGYHGHGAGPTIGLWNNQAKIPIKGDYKLYKNTCYAMELNIRKEIPEWSNQELSIFLEESVVFSKGEINYLDGRQTEFILI